MWWKIPSSLTVVLCCLENNGFWRVVQVCDYPEGWGCFCQVIASTSQLRSLEQLALPSCFERFCTFIVLCRCCSKCLYWFTGEFYCQRSRSSKQKRSSHQLSEVLRGRSCGQTLQLPMVSGVCPSDTSLDPRCNRRIYSAIAVQLKSIHFNNMKNLLHANE